ncbi:chromate transporter [Aquibacillus albus]|uniref:Chromate transporter n=1 Tax=Aquibacillus albus TaxID=1168171 RepID=A0ABS2MW04_9BACI|nr:chromate transporter [Aquibacillus albus]MBM7570031.1 chromate transporter [Aquibacillus albus]
MLYLDLFLAFLIPGIVGYGGGPATIPLIEHEVVERYGWITVDRFAEILALANTLPGPIATKMAGYIGYEVGGMLGAVLGIVATVVPSLLAMILLMGLLMKFKESPKIKKMTSLIRPAIGMLLAILAFSFFTRSWETAGIIQTVVLIAISVFFLEYKKVSPVLVIICVLSYGAMSGYVGGYLMQ